MTFLSLFELESRSFESVSLLDNLVAIDKFKKLEHLQSSLKDAKDGTNNCYFLLVYQ